MKVVSRAYTGQKVRSGWLVGWLGDDLMTNPLSTSILSIYYL